MYTTSFSYASTDQISIATVFRREAYGRLVRDAMVRSLLFGALLCAAGSNAQERAAIDASVVAKLVATITSRGILDGTVEVLANGSMRTPYRQVFGTNAAGVRSPELFGRFLQIRQTQSAPEVKNPDLPEQPMQIRFRIREEDFLLPIYRQQSLQLDLVPLASPLLPPLNGTIGLNGAGRIREEISVEIPPDFTARVGPPIQEQRAYAQYRSEAKIEGGRLLVVRELLLQPLDVAALSGTEREAFGKIIRADQEKPFVLRRISRTHPESFIQSVPPYQANHYGYLAQQQREYDAARQLFLRAIAAQPEDITAWNNLGRSLAALGDLVGAQKAYEKQISINPGDRFSYNNLGIVQERQGRWDAAVDSLRKQIEIHPGDTYATANLPRALIHARRWADAETAASNALSAQPGNAQQRLNLSIARVCQGKAEDPRREVGDALGASPTASLLNNAAYYLTECGKEGDLAESYIRKALNLVQSATAPPEGRSMSNAIAHQITISTYLDTYGWLLFQQNHMERAVSLLGAAATLAPRAELYTHLAQASSKSGRQDLAAVYWRESTFLEPGRISQVPAEIVSQLDKTPTLSLEPFWYPIPGASLATVGDELPVGQPSYFFVIADKAGKVTAARELDDEDQPARKILPVVRGILLPVVQLDDGQISTVQLVRVLKGPDGKVVAARSLGTEAVAIAGELAPAEFPSPTLASPTVSSNTGITPPRVLEKIDPLYSEEARKALLAGTVRVSFVVGSDGVARNFKVLQSLGLGLDESAIRAVSAWRFASGVKDGKPVEMASNVDVNFQLVGTGSKPARWHLSRVMFDAAPGATRPAVTHTAAPQVAADASRAAATVAFDIDEQGAVVHLQVKQTSDEGWGRDVLAALSKWKFTPALREGRPLPAPGSMDFVRGN
jgi:TonB family protein